MFRGATFLAALLAVGVTRRCPAKLLAFKDIVPMPAIFPVFLYVKITDGVSNLLPCVNCTNVA